MSETTKRIARIECNANVNACPSGDVKWLIGRLNIAMEIMERLDSISCNCHNPDGCKIIQAKRAWKAAEEREAVKAD